MKKRLKRLYGKKGLTLVEILVVLVVSSILLGCAMGMLAPAKNLIKSMKSNAHMDAMCDTANEYIRGELERAEKICIIPYSNLDSVKNQWKTYTDSYNASNGYSVRALGVMENYNSDFRLYDFGDVTVIDYSWGYDPSDPMITKSANDGIVPGNAFASLMKNRDGGGRWQKGLNGNEFHWFDAFNEEFYSNGATGQVNYSYQIAFEANSTTLDINGTAVDGVSYLTISSQVFRRNGKYTPKFDDGGNIIRDEDGKIDFAEKATFEPANQLKSLSFKLLNGKATLDQSNNVNSVEVDADGVKTIKLAEDSDGRVSQDGLVILYVVRDIEAYYNLP